MELKDQCCSIEQAKKLKELGVCSDSNLANYYDSSVGMCLLLRIANGTHEKEYPAYTLSEIAAVLTPCVDDDNWLSKAPDTAFKGYANKISNIWNVSICTDLLIWLLENNHITASECNERLRNS